MMPRPPRRALAIALACAALAGCGGGVLAAAERTSDGLARTINATQRSTVTAYEIAKEDAVREVALAGGTREQAEAALDRVRAKWRTVWDAYAVAGAAHSALVTLLGEYRATEGDVSVARIADAARRLHDAWRRVQAALCVATGRAETDCAEPPEETIP
jgi:hypothetical protein